MNTHLAIELFGYLGSILVLISMLMTSVVRLRTINTIGSLIFMTYALIIKSYPTALLNFFLIIVNLHHLRHLRDTAQNYQLVRLRGDDGFLGWFLDNYRADMLHFFPNLNQELALCDTAFAIFFGGSAAGILLAASGDGEPDTASFHLGEARPDPDIPISSDIGNIADCSAGTPPDYASIDTAAPKQNGNRMPSSGTGTAGKLRIIADYTTPAYRNYSGGAFLYDNLSRYGISALTFDGDQPEHIAYLEKMGFQKTGSGSYRRELGQPSDGSASRA